jgi:hypothetical protein
MSARCLAAVLSERATTHGDFYEASEIAQRLILTMERTEGWHRLQPHQQHALLQIATKISRILAGNPRFADHWTDIAGYSQLGSGVS